MTDDAHGGDGHDDEHAMNWAHHAARRRLFIGDRTSILTSMRIKMQEAP
jgi:hypothetical protein